MHCDVIDLNQQYRACFKLRVCMIYSDAQTPVCDKDGVLAKPTAKEIKNYKNKCNNDVQAHNRMSSKELSMLGFVPKEL